MHAAAYRAAGIDGVYLPLDGDAKPTVECLGAEDFYGHSWGFRGLASDSHAAIIRYDKTPQGGTRVAMIRARDTDRIAFRKSCSPPSKRSSATRA